MDAVEYFAAVEARQEPCTLTREDMVILALVQDTRTPGHCAACGALTTEDGPGARWCSLCRPILIRFWSLQGELRWRAGRKAAKFCSCGAPVEKGKAAHRCTKCQRAARLESQRRRARERTMREAMA